MWLFTLSELPGFVHNERVAVARLDPAFLTMPVMLLGWRARTKVIDKPVADLYAELPESNAYRADEVKAMFRLIEKVEQVLDGTDYWFELEGPRLPQTHSAFHTTASIQAVEAVLHRRLRVDRTSNVESYFLGSEGAWVLQRGDDQG